MFTGTRSAAVLAGVGLALPLLGCSDDAGGDGRVQVEAAFYPLAWVTEQVGGEHVAVHSLTAPGAEPHDLELTPGDVADVLDADLVVHLEDFQPAVDDAVDQADADRALDVTEAADLDPAGPEADHDHEHAEGDEHGHGDLDLHFWLDPERLASVGRAVADRLADVDPDHQDDFRANAEALAGRLGELDERYRTGLATCERHELVTSHSAFGYLARRYGLTQLGITGISPEAEPSPADLAEVTGFVREHGVTTIFFEALVSPALAETVASETGAATARLDPLEGLTDDAEGDDYVEVMDANLAHLRTALGCT